MELSTEAKIVEAAKRVFIAKGLDGARMQEIADEAGINKALLHYYYRNKNQLFEAVYAQVFGEVIPNLYNLLMRDLPLFDTIRLFFDVHIDFLKANPETPMFILREISKVAGFVRKMINENQMDIAGVVRKKISNAVEEGLVNPISAEELILNMVSLSAFQFIAGPMFQAVSGIDEVHYFKLVDARKKSLAEFVINSIKK